MWKRRRGGWVRGMQEEKVPPDQENTNAASTSHTRQGTERQAERYESQDEKYHIRLLKLCSIKLSFIL